MNKVFISLVIVISFFVLLSFRSVDFLLGDNLTVDSLRKIYAQPIHKWPKPTIDKGINYQELGITPKSPLNLADKKVNAVVDLGKMLFFDARLSSSNQISCASCHQPELHFSDGLKVSIGHNNTANTRNSPSIENVWFNKSLFLF